MPHSVNDNICSKQPDLYEHLILIVYNIKTCKVTKECMMQWLKYTKNELGEKRIITVVLRS